MPLLGLNEPAVTALAARLDDRLPTLVAELNAAVTDGFSIADPQQVLDYVPPLSQLTDLPTVGISDTASVFRDDIGSSATGHHTLTLKPTVPSAVRDAHLTASRNEIQSCPP